ncbi:hypothetical protein KM043_015764 [Ampulex compressa]|nr:hypothetical protein KM043_015764 [Ampulex compressa]
MVCVRRNVRFTEEQQNINQEKSNVGKLVLEDVCDQRYDHTNEMQGGDNTLAEPERPSHIQEINENTPLTTRIAGRPKLLRTEKRSRQKIIFYKAHCGRSRTC